MWREQELIVDRISPDNEFIKKALDQATNFFKYSLLPELLGKFYSRLPSQKTNEPEAACESEPLSVPHHDQNAQSSAPQENHSSQEQNQEVWCYCRTEESGEMI